MQNKVVILGLDGATWKLLDKFVERRLMPNLAFLMKNGTYGILKSTFPPFTAPAWTSFVTGKNPGKHSCYDFFAPHTTLSKPRPLSSLDIKSLTFYEIMNNNRMSSIFINMPLSTPIRTNDIFVASVTSPSATSTIYPPEMLQLVPELRNYKPEPDPKLLMDGDFAGYFRSISRGERDRFEIAKKLFRMKWDLFFLLISGTDRLQHIAFSDLIRVLKGSKQPNELLKIALEFYIQVDAYIEWLFKNIDEDTIFFIISDHGCKIYQGSFFINKWLEKEDYLKIFRDYQETLYEKLMEIVCLILRLPFVNLAKLFYRFNKMARKFHLIDEVSISKINISKTTAYMFSSLSHGIYINDQVRFRDGPVPSKERMNLVNEITNKLMKSRDGRGEKIFENIYRATDIYKGEYVDKAPDLLIWSNKYKLDDTIKPSVLIKSQFNDHDFDGIFLAYGPGIKKGARTDLEIYDIAPTILHIFNLPIPNDTDGKVATEIFDQKSDFLKRQFKYDSYTRLKLRSKIKRSRLTKIHAKMV